MFIDVFLAKLKKPRKTDHRRPHLLAIRKKRVTPDNSSPDTKEKPHPTNVEAHETIAPLTTVRVSQLQVLESTLRPTVRAVPRLFEYVDNFFSSLVDETLPSVECQEHINTFNKYFDFQQIFQLLR